MSYKRNARVTAHISFSTIDQLNLTCLIMYGYIRHLKLFLATRSSMLPMIIIGLA